MHTLTVTLKQHTPLIHFQHDQEGATLRASEVKPKLDRFILTKLGNGNYQEGIKKANENGWLVGKGEHPALDYKMRIEAEGLQEPEDPNKFIRVKDNGKNEYAKSPMYFANMGKDVEPKYYSQCDKCKLIVISKKQSLHETLVIYIADFFLTNNFGTRQTKGYGSFTVQSSLPKVTFHSPKLFFTVTGDRNRLFEEMEWFHKTIRGGINDCFGKRLYFKSLMFSYAKSKKQQWDKRTIKQTYYPKELQSQKNRYENSDLLLYSSEKDKYHYSFRDCLGLSTVELWKKPYDKTIEKISDTIDRFMSPIVFKPVSISNNQWKVYILYTELPEEYKGAVLDVKSNGEGELKLQIPSFFTIKDYFDFLFKKNQDGTFKVDIKSQFLVKDYVQKMNEIIRIFNELRGNYNK